MLSRIKKDILVEVISGRDKGKQGKVVAVDRKHDLVKVRGVGIVTKHKKAKSQKEPGRITKEESFIRTCKVMPVCPESKKPCRVRVARTEDGKKVLVSQRSGEEIQ
ncbi:50S ribosomal protein L24 [bacterium]|nr:50S ribosomal protein L24 [bacterium]